MNTIFSTPTVLAHNGVDHSTEHVAAPIVQHSFFQHNFHLFLFGIAFAIVLAVIIWGKEDTVVQR
ncbi:MAG: hypothetical protein V4519_01350 [Patescibacteria group bacterium]